MKKIIFLIAIYFANVLSAFAAPELEAYGHLPAVELLRLSPNGQRYAAITVVGETRKFIAATPEGKVLTIANVGMSKVRAIEWADDDHVLIMVTSYVEAPFVLEQAYEMAAVLSIRVTDGNEIAVFEKHSTIVDAVFGMYGESRDQGGLYGYFGGITTTRHMSGQQLIDHGYPDLYKVNLDTGEVSRQAKGSEAKHAWVVASDGETLAHSEYKEQTGQWILYKGKGNNEGVIAETLSSLNQISLQGQGRTSGTVLVSSHTGTVDKHEEISIVNGKREELFSSISVKKFLHDPDSGLLIGAVINNDSDAIFFNSPMQARYNATRKAFPGLHMRPVSFSRNLDRLVVETEGPKDSGTYWFVDMATKHADPIGQAYPSITGADVAPNQWFNYRAADGLEIQGVLTLPLARKAEKLPLIVLPHGGPIGLHDTLDFDWWAQDYAAAGYAVLQPNYRGSSGYTGEFLQAGFGQWGRKMQSDISDGVSALAAQGLIDPKRVCIVGASYGGYAALAGTTLQKAIYRCAVSVNGPADMEAFFSWQETRHGSQSAITRYWREVTGSKEDLKAMRAISPINFAAMADAPILLIHGKDDTVVPSEQSTAMAEALKKANKPVELVLMDGEDHWLSREASRITMLKAAMAFVKKNNPPD